MNYLFFLSKRICYDSPRYFARVMIESLEKQGHKCTVCQLTEKPDLKSLEGIPFAGIFGFNSTVPQLQVGEEDYFLDHLDGPFYNWLLDHPLYHHPSLASGARNHHVFTLDEKHTAYLKRYYPHLASVETRPLFTMPFEEEKLLPIEERPIPLLFTGTYTPQTMLDRRMAELPEDARRDVRELIDIMESDFSLSAEEALQTFLERRRARVYDPVFREFLWRYYLADTAVAAHTRHRVICGLLEGGIPLTVSGHGWDKLDCKGKENLTILPERTFEKSLDLTYRARILLNIMPNFKAGLHDRVLTAMGHGAVALSDRTEYLDRYFRAGENYLAYSADTADLGELITLLKKYTKTSEADGRLSQISHEGLREARSRRFDPGQY